MTVNKINTWFKSAGHFQLRRRWAFLIVLAAFTIVGFLGLPRLVLESDDDDWFSNSVERQAAEDRFKELFGNSDAVAVLVEADDVFDPEVLDAIDRLGKRLEAEVPFANEVTSLMQMSISRGVEGGLEVINPFEDGIPGGGIPLSEMSREERTELQEKKDFIMSRESLVNNLVSDDATETWVFLSLLPYEDERTDMIRMGKVAIPIVESDEFKSDKYTMKGSGMGYTEAEEERVVKQETMARLSAGFIVMVLCLIIFVRSLRGVIVPVVATLGGIGSVLGYSAWFGIHGNSNLITLPILLGMALSIGYAIHYINGFKNEFRARGKRKEAAIAAVAQTGWPILFTVVTTMVSFISFFFTDINALKWVGGVCAFIVLSVYLYVIVLLPILYSFGKDAHSQRAAPSEKALAREQRALLRHEKVDSIYATFGEGVLKARLPILVASIVVMLVSVLFMTRIEVNMDYISMMGKKIPYVARMIEIMNSKLGNQYTYQVMVELPEEEAFKNPHNMQTLDDLAKDFGTLSLTKISGTKPRVQSVADTVKEMNRALNEDRADAYVIPSDAAILAEELGLYEIMGGDDLFTMLSDDYSTAYINVDLREYNAKGIDADIANARRMVNERFPDGKNSCIGIVIDFAMMNQTLVWAELKSMLGTFVMILIILIVAFSSVKTGLIGMIPNVAPVLLVGGLMGAMRYPLDMLTMTIMPMILGIAVDDTIHFTNHVKLEHETAENYHDAIVNSFVKIGRSMLATTVILCAMFIMYMFSPMNMLFRIGLLSSVGLFAALVADYTLTPALLYMTKSFGGRHKN